MMVASIALVNLLFVQIECVAAAAVAFAVYKFALFVHHFPQYQKVNSVSAAVTVIKAINPLTLPTVSA
jgi:hypothetical protein